MGNEWSGPDSGDAVVVDDLPVDNRQERAHLLDFYLWHREVITIQNRQVGELAWLDCADLVFHSQEPAVAAREHTDCFITGEVLVAVDTSSEGIHSGHGEVDVKPGIQRRDV